MVDKRDDDEPFWTEEIGGEEFSWCCGIDIIGNFPEDGIALTAKNKSDLDIVVNSLVSENKLSLVALTDQQRHMGLSGVIGKRGFRQIARFRNGPNGNMITLFAYVGKQAQSLPYEAKKKVPKEKPKWR